MCVCGATMPTVHQSGYWWILGCVLLSVAFSSFADATACVDEPSDSFAGGAKYNCFGLRWTTVPSGLVPVAQNTTWVNFANNRLVRLPPALFGGFSTRRTNVRLIELQSNQISAIPTGMFNSLVQLEHLNLGSNPIWAIQPDFFSAIPQLPLLTPSGLFFPSGTRAILQCSARLINGATYPECNDCAQNGVRHFVDYRLDTCCIPDWQELCFTPSPTAVPTRSPTSSPSISPSISPSASPTISPSHSPTVAPTRFPSSSPTISPSSSPTLSPTESPTKIPTASPSTSPTGTPTSAVPTVSPTTTRPTLHLETWPPTRSPTLLPSTGPTKSPSHSPTTSNPTTSPSVSPTRLPTVSPTQSLLFPLALASLLGEAQLVEQLLEANVSLEATDGSGATALHVAARHGHLDVLNMLIAAGANMGHRANDGTSVFLAASDGGHVNIMSALLQLGSNPLELTLDGRSALHGTGKGGYLPAVEFLLNLTSASTQLLQSRTISTGTTPLHEAAAGGHVEVVEVLLEAGLDSYVTRKDGTTPLLVAASAGMSSVVQILVASTIPTSQIDLAIIAAAERGFTHVIEILLPFVSNVNSVGPTAAAAAVVNGHAETAVFFINQNISISPTPEHEVFQAAVRYGITNAVASLLAQGVSADGTSSTPDEATAFPMTSPLCLSAAGGHAAVITLLVDYGAAMEQDCGDGRSPLSVAVSEGSVSAVVSLLSSGASVASSDNMGNTPISICARQGNASVMELLIANGGDIHSASPASLTPLALAAQEGHSATVQVLIRAGADIDAFVGQQGDQTALVLALSNLHTDVVEVILGHNATFDFTDIDKVTSSIPLAAEAGLFDFLLELLSAFDSLSSASSSTGSVSLSNSSATEPLPDRPSSLLLPNILIAACRGGHSRIVRLALDGGVDPDWTVNNSIWRGGTGLEVASSLGHFDVVEVLLNSGATFDSKAIIDAVYGNHAAVLVLLTENNVSDHLNVLINGSTPLVAAAANSNVNTTGQLLGAGAMTGLTDSFGRTPLVAAVLGGSIATTQLLLDTSKAEVNIADDAGITPLWHAARARRLDLVQILLAAGASIDPNDAGLVLPPSRLPAASTTVPATAEIGTPEPNDDNGDEILGLGIDGTTLIIIASVVGSLMVGCILYKALKPDSKESKSVSSKDETYDPDLELPFEEGASFDGPLKYSPGPPAIVNQTYTHNVDHPAAQPIIMLPAGTQLIYQSPQDAPMSFSASPSPAKTLDQLASPADVDFGAISYAQRDNADAFAIDEAGKPQEVGHHSMPSSRVAVKQPTVQPPDGPGVSSESFGTSAV